MLYWQDAENKGRKGRGKGERIAIYKHDLFLCSSTQLFLCRWKFCAWINKCLSTPNILRCSTRPSRPPSAHAEPTSVIVPTSSGGMVAVVALVLVVMVSGFVKCSRCNEKVGELTGGFLILSPPEPSSLRFRDWAAKKMKTWRTNDEGMWLTWLSNLSIGKNSFQIAALCGNRGAVNNALQTAGATEAFWFLPVVWPTSLSLWDTDDTAYPLLLLIWGWSYDVLCTSDRFKSRAR